MAALASCLVLQLVAQTPGKDPELAHQNRTVRLGRVSHPPDLGEFLDGGEPPGQSRITDFRQLKPADGKPVSRATRAYLSYDDTNLYAVFVCTDQTRNLRAGMSKRDDIQSDDTVALYLDTFRDRERVLGLYVNPFGIQADAVTAEGQEEDFSYDLVWRSEGRITADGYAVLMAIPFRSLRFSPADVQTWGIGLARFIPAINEASYWPYYTARIAGFAQQLGTAEGLEGISPGRNIQFVPYGVFTESRYLDDSGYLSPFFNRKTEFRGGFDSKIIVRDALTLDVTVNPDFSQVESDEPQVTVNQRFEVYFPEKRPFFLENATYFATPENLFFSRRIVSPEFGVRMTGKMGHWLLGILGTDDRAPGTSFAPADPAYGDHAVVGAVRIQREFGEQSTVGILATSYNFGNAAEQVFSFDTRLKLTDNLVFTGQAIRSQTHQATGNRYSGADYFADLTYSGLHLNSSTRYLDRSPTFDSLLGYVPRVDIRQIQENTSWNWLPAGRLIKSFGPMIDATADVDHAGRMQDWIVSPGFNWELVRRTYLTIQRTEAVEVFDHLRFRKHSTDFAVGTDFSKHVGIQAGWSAGVRVDYYPGTDLLPFLAPGKDLNLRLTLRPTARMKLDTTYIFSHLSTLGKSLIESRYGRAAIYNNHLFRETVNYQFTRALSVRAILSYDGVLPNAQLIDLERVKSVTGDLLMTWLLSPGTALYVGYTDQRQNLVLAPGIPPGVERIGDPSTVTGRQFFVKFSYLLRF